MLLIVALALLGMAAFLVAEAVTVPARQRALSLQRVTSYGRPRTSPATGSARLAAALGRTRGPLARIALRLNPRTSEESVRAKLLTAGLAHRITPTTFLAAKAALGLGVLAVGIATNPGMTGILLGLGFGVLSFLLPDLLLTARASRRRESIRAALPDALDLLTVSVEAGLGFDAALAKLSEYLEGPVAEEFALTLNEMRVGESRQEALKRLAERVNAPELGSFTRAIIQSDQLGMSLGRILRSQAEDTRNRRQTEAEEKAMKAPIKMLFPTVLFIFPAMFLVILGPAVINLLNTL
jgi:tight adherence protein C